MLKRHSQLFLLIAALAAFSLLAVGCQPQPEPTPAPEPFPAPVEFEANVLPPGPDLPRVQLRPGQALVDEQLVITGVGADIDRVLGALPELQLEPLTSTSFDYLERYQLPAPGGDRDQQQSVGKRRRSGLSSVMQQEMATLRVDLYAFSAGTPPLSDTLQIIADTVEELGQEQQVRVVAEPNYVMGFEITGDPWAVEGSPWAVEGSPWAVEGSPADGGPHASDHFWQQWALDAGSGIGLFSAGAPPAGRNAEGVGEGIRVAVFDTSPFSGPGGYRFDRWGPPDVPSLALTVSEPVVVPVSMTGEDIVLISDHGLFVSGLAYAVAPAAEIHLVKVLNEHGQGTLQAFIDALNLYMQENASPPDGLNNTIINLSLGTSEPDDEELPPEARRAIARMLAVWGYRPLAGEDSVVFSLELPMLIAEGLGATIVAASGNDSMSPPEAAPLPSQIPAAYPQILGVEASNQQQARSCFANEGDLAAPGGDGDANCEPDLEACEGIEGGSCGAGVVSYVLAEHEGFAYWAGTSFATPLVSGLAGLVQEAGAGNPDVVRQTVLCSAQNTGIVDVVEALTSCATP
ncbi:MAG TPA: S8 family serine peptidase [Candidatus Sulfomarinibacteraceae bacterium]|nr:S8 family serine peptidase [Candidatus Sulfomarinibacteraceae bacterium]